MGNLTYKKSEFLLQALLYNSPYKSEKIISRYSRLWWDNVAYKCTECKHFDGYDMCCKKGTFGAVVDDTLFKCGNYTDVEINENLQNIEDIVIEEFPDYFSQFNKSEELANYIKDRSDKRLCCTIQYYY